MSKTNNTFNNNQDMNFIKDSVDINAKYNAKLGESQSQLYKDANDFYFKQMNAILDSKATEQEKLLAIKELVSKSNVDWYSNQKGIEQNNMYAEYMDGSIKNNFNTQVDIMNQRIAIMEQEAKIKIMKETAEAEIELAKLNKEIEEIKKQKRMNWFNRIFYPALGIALGVLTYVLLFIIK